MSPAKEALVEQPLRRTLVLDFVVRRLAHGLMLTLKSNRLKTETRPKKASFKKAIKKDFGCHCIIECLPVFLAASVNVRVLILRDNCW